MRTFFFSHLRYAILLLLTCYQSSCTTNASSQAPNIQARFADQMLIASNACGPTALLNSLRSGDEYCQNAAASIPGESDTQKLRHLILHYGAKKSRHMPSRIRWSKRGINPVDLTDVANEIHPSGYFSLTFAKGTGAKLIKNAHNTIAHSIRKGVPPIVCIRRYIGNIPAESHFISIVAISAFTDNSEEISFTCIDPAGGRKILGTLRIDPLQPRAIIASLPDASFVKNTPSSAKIVMDAMILSDPSWN